MHSEIGDLLHTTTLKWLIKLIFLDILKYTI